MWVKWRMTGRSDHPWRWALCGETDAEGAVSFFETEYLPDMKRTILAEQLRAPLDVDIEYVAEHPPDWVVLQEIRAIEERIDVLEQTLAANKTMLGRLRCYDDARKGIDGPGGA